MQSIQIEDHFGNIDCNLDLKRINSKSVEKLHEKNLNENKNFSDDQCLSSLSQSGINELFHILNFDDLSFKNAEVKKIENKFLMMNDILKVCEEKEEKNNQSYNSLNSISNTDSCSLLSMESSEIFELKIEEHKNSTKEENIKILIPVEKIISKLNSLKRILNDDKVNFNLRLLINKCYENIR